MSAFTIIIVILAILLIFLVLIQNSKGGGLASGFAGGNQVMGAPKTADFLEKTTWTLIALIAVLSVLAVGFGKGGNVKGSDESQVAESMQEALDNNMQQSAPEAGAVDFEEAAAAQEAE